MENNIHTKFNQILKLNKNKQSIMDLKCNGQLDNVLKKSFVKNQKIKLSNFDDF